MSERASHSYVREALVAERTAPVKTTGLVGFVRTRLFNSPTNIVLTILGALLIWFTVVPSLKFLFVDAVWTGSDRNACLEANAGHPVGACWPYIQAKYTQFIYGFYPEPERWRVNLTFALGCAAAAAAADPAAAGQEPQCRAFLHRIPGRGVLPAAWRRPQRLCHQLDRGRAVELRAASSAPASAGERGVGDRAVDGCWEADLDRRGHF